MKRIILAGMVAFTGNLSFAQVKGAKETRVEQTKDFKQGLENRIKEVREKVLAGAKTADVGKWNEAQTQKFAESIGKTFGKSPVDVKKAIKGKNGDAVADQLITVAAAKRYAATKGNESIKKAADVTADLLLNLDLIEVSKPHTKAVAQKNATKINDALLKIGEVSTRILTEFSADQREAWIPVLSRFNELMAKPGSSNTAADNLIQAIMDVKGVSEEQAFEYIEAILRDC